MLLAYVDESYNDELFFLGALIVDARAAVRIERGLDAIVEDYASTSDLPSSAELHGYEIFHGQGDWASLHVRQLINVYDRALQAIGSSGARIVLRGMDVARQQTRFGEAARPPHDVVLGHLLERVDHVAATTDDHLVVVADEIHSSDRHRTNFRLYRREGTPGYRSSRLPALIDTLYFGPSKFSRLLQAADLVTFMHKRRQASIETDVRQEKAIARMWTHVEPAVVHDWTWRP